MTGFGQAGGENESYRVAVSVRSVNHRFLDLAIRLAEEYRDVEPAVRRLLDERLDRGRVDLRVAIDFLGAGGTEVTIDGQVVAGLLRAAAQIDAAGLSSKSLTTADLLKLPEVVRVRRRSGELAPVDRELILEVANQALDSLLEMREHEGEQLAGALQARLEELAELVARLSAEREGVRRRLLENMRQRVEDLLAGKEITPEQLARETALLAEKIDVQEELDRLAAHMEAFDRSMASEESIGRRLDFLAQEIHRELNTLGVKCRDAKMAQWVVDGKVACEQLREQVQNVE
ncbi:MAG: YicC family protein [Acidobacteria bacterium]|nr:YicC family protein [Acidobacteriota bacterium]